jgi:hypothetical protein
MERENDEYMVLQHWGSHTGPQQILETAIGSSCLRQQGLAVFNNGIRASGVMRNGSMRER